MTMIYTKEEEVIKEERAQKYQNELIPRYQDY